MCSVPNSVKISFNWKGQALTERQKAAGIVGAIKHADGWNIEFTTGCTLNGVPHAVGDWFAERL